MKVFNIALAILFALFAIVQFNDPDPWGWEALYGMVALVSALAAFGIYRQWVIVAGMVICVVWMATLLPDFIDWIQMGAPNIAAEMKATEPYIELTREFLGLFIAGVALAWHFFRARKRGQ